MNLLAFYHLSPASVPRGSGSGSAVFATSRIYIQWQATGIPSDYPKPMKSPLAQVEIKPAWLKTRLMVAGMARRSFRCRVIKSQSLAGLLLIMRHRNTSSLHDRFRERTHTSPRINDRLCRYVLLSYESCWSSRVRMVNRQPCTVVKFR